MDEVRNMEAKHDEPAYYIYIYVVFAYKIINAYTVQNPLKAGSLYHLCHNKKVYQECAIGVR